MRREPPGAEQHDDPAAVIRPQPDGSGALRDILIHMIEETARHVGHMDMLREQIDGATGDFVPETTP